MIPILTAAVGVIGGLLMGGCAGSSDEISKSLMSRNAELENQLTGAQLTLTGLAVTAVILACGLGVSLFHNAQKGRDRGREKSRQKARQ